MHGVFCTNTEVKKATQGDKLNGSALAQLVQALSSIPITAKRNNKINTYIYWGWACNSVGKLFPKLAESLVLQHPINL